MLGLFSRKLQTSELTQDLEELLIEIGRLEERLAAKHRKNKLKTNETELKKELEQLRKRLLDAKQTLGDPTSVTEATFDGASKKSEINDNVEIRDQKTVVGIGNEDELRVSRTPPPRRYPFTSEEVREKRVIRNEGKEEADNSNQQKPMVSPVNSKPDLRIQTVNPDDKTQLPRFKETTSEESRHRRDRHLGGGADETQDSKIQARIQTTDFRLPSAPPPPSPTGATNRFRWSSESIASELHPKTNEDSWLVVPEMNAAAVFDGVSAASLAAEASLRAGRHIERSLKAITQIPTAEELPELLGVILHGANDLLWRMNQANKTNELATTVTLAMLTTYQDKPAVAYASVGDSRLSIWHTKTSRYELAALDDQLLRLFLSPPAKRPSWVAAILKAHNLSENFQVSPIEMVKLAKILDGLADPATATPVAKALFAERNLVTQSLGMPTIVPHIGLVKLEPTDRVLLATDGLHDNLTENEITEILSLTPITEVAAALVVRAHEVAESTAPRAKKDDITAVVLEIV